MSAARIPDPDRQTFPKELRVRLPGEYHRAYESGRFAADGMLVVNLVENGLAWSRLGVVVSRHYGKAHDRQRWKRVVRDVFRRHRSELPPGWDIVVKPRRGATCDSPRINQSLVPLVRRALKMTPKQKPGRGRR